MDEINFGLFEGKDIVEALKKQHALRQEQMAEVQGTEKPLNRWQEAARVFAERDLLRGESENLRKLFKDFRTEFVL